jgi:iron complex outermembrane receptor protein
MNGAKTAAIWSLLLGINTLPARAAADAGLPESPGESTDSATAASDSSTLESVVVTAQRRRERLQDVPIHVTAITEAQISQANISNTAELVEQIPGVEVGMVAHGSQSFMRGIGTANNTTGDEPSVATYVDGVYIQDFNASILNLRNVQSIEVLNGPQGTLFGRNALGGLINIRTRDPQPGASVEGSLGYGNYATTEDSVYATGGTDTLATDLSVYYLNQGDGFGHNLDTGQDVSYRSNKTLRSKTLWKPTESDRITFIADWSSDKNNLAISRHLLPGYFGYFNLPSRGGADDSGGDLNPSVPFARNYGATLHYEHEFSWATLSLLSAYRNDNNQFQYQNSTYASRVVQDIRVHDESHEAQNEATLIGTWGRLQYTTGLFFLGSKAGYLPEPLSSQTTPSINIEYNTYTKLQSYAAFSQATYAITPFTGITVGARYTYDDRSAVGSITAQPGNAKPLGTILQATTRATTFGSPTWRLAVDHHFTSDVMVFGSYDRGYKSGVYNVADLASAPVRPETVDDFELGIKSEFGGIWRLNATAFFDLLHDIQLQKANGVGAGLILFNAASGKIYGLDTDLSVAPRLDTGRLQFDAAVEYLHARYTDFPNGPVGEPNPAGGMVFATADLSGNTMLKAPTVTLKLSGDYSVVAGPGELGVNVSYYHNSGYFWEPDNRLRQDPYDVENASVRYSFGKDLQYRLTLWGKNLGNAVYYHYVQTNAGGVLASGNIPRTFGASISFKF